MAAHWKYVALRNKEQTLSTLTQKNNILQMNQSSPLFLLPHSCHMDVTVEAGMPWSCKCVNKVSLPLFRCLCAQISYVYCASVYNLFGRNLSVDELLCNDPPFPIFPQPTLFVCYLGFSVRGFFSTCAETRRAFISRFGQQEHAACTRTALNNKGVSLISSVRFICGMFEMDVIQRWIRERWVNTRNMMFLSWRHLIHQRTATAPRPSALVLLLFLSPQFFQPTPPPPPPPSRFYRSGEGPVAWRTREVTLADGCFCARARNCQERKTGQHGGMWGAETGRDRETREEGSLCSILAPLCHSFCHFGASFHLLPPNHSVHLISPFVQWCHLSVVTDTLVSLFHTSAVV